MSFDQVAAYYRHVFRWDVLESFVTRKGSIPFHETLWKFIYLGDAERWSKWRWFTSIHTLRAHVLESFDGFHKPISTLNYGNLRTREGQRFLTLDVDLNDYGSLRNLVCACGTQKQACVDCWDFWITRNVIPILKRCLQDTWGFQDVSYVFSGRRGLHIHVRDVRALRMSAQQRAMVLESFKHVPVVDICWSQLEARMRLKTRQECPELFEQCLSACNPLPGQYFGGENNLGACCDYVQRHLPTAQQWEDFKDAVCRLVCAPKFDVPVTEQLTHACKVPETLHQVTLNVCGTFMSSHVTSFRPLQPVRALVRKLRVCALVALKRARFPRDLAHAIVKCYTPFWDF
jgi:DNA primase catalytic subunit